MLNNEKGCIMCHTPFHNEGALPEQEEEGRRGGTILVYRKRHYHIKNTNALQCYIAKRKKTNEDITTALVDRLRY